MVAACRIWLEAWTKAAADLGLRALEQLRVGVERAIEALGRGFLHPRNADLIRWLKARAGELKSRTDRVGLLGVSSGAHQAMLSALRPRDRICAHEVLSIRRRQVVGKP